VAGIPTSLLRVPRFERRWCSHWLPWIQPSNYCRLMWSHAMS